jgi:hypothetical protein
MDGVEVVVIGAGAVGLAIAANAEHVAELVREL